MKTDFTLTSNDALTVLTKAKGISTWRDLTSYVTHLPYGRNGNRTDLSLILKEQKGTCSSKHALLKEIAHLNAIPNVKLVLGIYRMNASNTPKIGDVLTENNLEFIPEAHCYLKIGDKRLDFTSSNSDFRRIKNDVLIEHEIEPQQVADFKVEYHKRFIKNWITEEHIRFSFDDIWTLREQCIANLSA